MESSEAVSAQHPTRGEPRTYSEARGAEAEVPVWVSVQSLCRSALVWGVSGEKEMWENM